MVPSVVESDLQEQRATTARAGDRAVLRPKQPLTYNLFIRCIACACVTACCVVPRYMASCCIISADTMTLIPTGGIISISSDLESDEGRKKKKLKESKQSVCGTAAEIRRGEGSNEGKRSDLLRTASKLLLLTMPLACGNTQTGA